MKRGLIGAVLAATAALTLLVVQPATAAPGSKAGTYGAFTTSGMALAPGFPSAVITSDDPGLAAAASATLTGATPFGAVYGTSSGRTYLSLHPTPDSMATPSVPTTTTLTFPTATPIGGWSFALGDVDADSVTINGTDAAGNPLVEAGLGFVSVFNGAGGADVPVWTGATRTLTGNGADTDGATAWFTPATGIRTLSFTVTRQTGAPVIQLWIAAITASLAGTVAAPEGGAPASATVVLTDPSGAALPGEAATAAVTGGAFEFPAVFPVDVGLQAVDPSRAPGAVLPVSPVAGAFPVAAAVVAGALIPAGPGPAPAQPALAPTGLPVSPLLPSALVALGAVLIAADRVRPRRRRSGGRHAVV